MNTPRAEVTDRIGGVLLAAGGSSRMGRPKQLLPYRGRPLLQHAVDRLVHPALSEVVLVLGHEADRILSELELPEGFRVVLNPEWAEGQNRSLQLGLGALSPEVRAALVLVGDQPGIPDRAMDAVLALHRLAGAPVIRPHYLDGPGHPVLLDRRIWKEIAADGSDEGARRWMRDNPGRVRTVAVPLSSPPEVDTEGEYLRLLEADGGGAG